jgi:pyruvate/2-oxoglutarate dehydrogenase complex dihydrolipoamide acyltransferase (E2) component
MLHRIKLHKIAETTDVVVVDQWNVKVGDVVEANQSLASLETDKVTVDFPSPIAGTVTELLIAEGDEARTGEQMLVIEA